MSTENKIRKNFYIDRDLIERLEKISKVTGAPQAEIVRRALEAFLSR